MLADVGRMESFTLEAERLLTCTRAFPFGLEAELVDPMVQIGGWDVRVGRKDGADVIEMFLGLAFAEEEKFVNDDRGGWGKPIGAKRGFDLLTLLQFPAGEFGFTGKITVGPQRAVMVDDIEMAAGFTGDFSKEHFGGGKIEVGGREGADERGDVIWR